MFKRFNNRQHYLHLRVAKAIALVAMLSALASSWIFYKWTYHNEIQLAERLIEQLVKTLEDTAAVGAYLDNPDIPQQVVDSLSKHDVIAGVVIHTSTGFHATYMKDHSQGEDKLRWLHFPLHNPFGGDDPYEEHDLLGEIKIHPNQPLLESRARMAAWKQASLMSVQILLVAALVMALVHHLFTRPLRGIAQALHNVDPRQEARLACPPGHDRDEIGGLVDDINDLLVTVHYALETERQQRSTIESLGRQFRLIFERASTGILLMTPAGEVVLANNTLYSLLRKPTHEKALPPQVPQWFAMPTKIHEIVAQTLATNVPVGLDLALSTALETDVVWVHCLFSKVDGDNAEQFIEIIVNDITERKQKEQQVRFEADHDPLTQALNRRAGEHALQLNLMAAASSDSEYAILLIDLDKFKPINDNYGHEAGDQVLIQVTRRLQTALRRDDLVIRWGGDEFVIVLKSFNEVTDISTVGEKIVTLLNTPMELDDGRLCQIGASIGIALFPLHGKRFEDLIAAADIAMYDIKEHGRNGFCIFDVQPYKRVTWYLHKPRVKASNDIVPPGCVLIVDDSEHTRVFLKTLVGHYYQVLLAANGQQALQIVREQTPDVVLLDVMMPGMNGFEVCREMKLLPNMEAVPILFLTALTGTKEKLAAFDVGAVDYIAKPFQEDEVMARVRTHLALYRLQTEWRDKHQELQQQYAELAAFTEAIADELHPPLQKLIQQTEQVHEPWRQVIRKTAHTVAALSLLGEVLGQREMPLETVSMRTIIAHAQQRLTQSINLEMPAQWPTVCSIPRWLEEVWLQYLSNALEHGGGHITLGWDQADAFIRYWVQDRGVGLSDSEQACLFVPFTRLHAERISGHGLGLCIVRGIISQLGGTVGVISTPGQGSRFYFTLPREASNTEVSTSPLTQVVT